MATDLQRAYAALDGKRAAYDRLWRYADGDHPLTYTNERLREVFRSLDARFVENWCSVVLNATLERIQLTGFQATDATAQATLERLWSEHDLALEADEAHEAASVCGESFLIAWPDAQGVPQAYYNDPRLCHVFYDGENPRVGSWAAKWWDDPDEKRHLTLYYPDRLEYYISTGKAENVSSANSFREELAPQRNPFGEVPVFHFRPRRRVTLSDLADVIPIQNGVNKLLSDMMVAAEYGAFAQRWIISQTDTSMLKNAPNEIWSIPAGDGVGQQTQVGQFAATDLKNYLDAIDRLATAIAIITRTPKHYFLSQAGDPSGEALIAMEAPLNKKAQSRIERYTPTWQRLAAFLLRLSGQAVPPTAITPQWEDPATVQPRTQAEVRQMATAAGLPLVTVLRREGWTDDEIAAMLADRQEEQAEAQATLAQAMIRAQREFDGGADGTKDDNG